jgi:hypothetical protein
LCFRPQINIINIDIPKGDELKSNGYKASCFKQFLKSINDCENITGRMSHHEDTGSKKSIQNLADFKYLETAVLAAVHWLLAVETGVQSQMTLGKIHGTKWYRSRFISEFFSFPTSHHPSLLHTDLSPPREVCESPDQATHYHTLCPNL